MVAISTRSVFTSWKGYTEFLDLLLKFWSSDEEKYAYSTAVVMPRTWTPKMYLGVLYFPINQHMNISIERIKLTGNTYTSINDVHAMFLVPTLKPRLTMQEGLF